MPDVLSFDGAYRFLSNFYPARVLLDGAAYPTTEHAYQAAKTLDEDLRALIRGSATPGQAKRIGRRALLRADWEGVKIDVMRDLLQQKFAQEPLRAMLLATGSRVLIEGNHWGDTFWGVCNGVGANNLGRLLMAVRAELMGDVLD